MYSKSTVLRMTLKPRRTFELVFQNVFPKPCFVCCTEARRKTLQRRMVGCCLCGTPHRQLLLKKVRSSGPQKRYHGHRSITTSVRSISYLLAVQQRDLKTAYFIPCCACNHWHHSCTNYISVRTSSSRYTAVAPKG